MKTEQTYLDVYSHSAGTAKNAKSKGSFKNILCFLISLIILSSSFAFYYLGVYVAGKKNNSSAASVFTENSKNKSDDNVSPDIENVLNCTVGIYAYNDTQGSYASGVIISDDGYIVTNDHVFDGIASADIIVYDNNGEYYDAAFIGGDKKYDIAVVKIEKNGLDFMKLTDEIGVSVGDNVFSIGCPMNESLQSSVTSGIISGVDRRINVSSSKYPIKLIQTDAPINPGCSGGALINKYGQLIGINCSKVVDESFEGIGFAIPNNILYNNVMSIIEHGTVVLRARLGITYTCIEYTHSLIDGIQYGILIENVNPVSDMYGKGPKAGDTIISINGNRIYREGDFLDVIESCAPGEYVKLVISQAGGSQFETEVKLIEDKSQSYYCTE